MANFCTISLESNIAAQLCRRIFAVLSVGAKVNPLTMSGWVAGVDFFGKPRRMASVHDIYRLQAGF